VAAKTAVDALLLRIAPAVVHACVLYFMIGYQRTCPRNASRGLFARADFSAFAGLSRRFFIFLATLLLHSLASAAQAMALSAAAPAVGVANLACSFVFLQSAVFGGLLTNTAALPNWLSWLRYTSLEFYAFEAIVANEFAGLTFVLGIDTIQGVAFRGDVLLTSALSLDARHVGPNLVCLLAWLLLFAALAAAITALRHR
jgi:hypothetical protein